MQIPIIEITNYINSYRAKHGSPPLEWDETIAKFSQTWASYLGANGKFEHSKERLYGENLACFMGNSDNMLPLVKKSIDMWYNEIAKYDFQKNTYTPGTGHFTCLVWKSSTKFGIGYSYDTKTKTAIVTFNTSPAGNNTNTFKSNVFPPK